MLSQIIPALVADNPQSIRAYFEKVRELAKSGNPYPVFLDDVWPLCFERKDAAVRALKSDFTQGYHYQAVHKNVELKKGRTRQVLYSLSVSCMEWLVAKRVQPVFDVYREVFHKVADMVEQTLIDRQTALVSLTNSLIERIEGLEGKIDRLNKSREKYFKAKVVEKNQQTYQKQVDARKQERIDLFDLFHRYVQVHNFQAADRVMDTLIDKVREYFNLDLRIQKRSPGEHYFDVAIRFNMGYCIAETIKCHMYKSAQLK